MSIKNRAGSCGCCRCEIFAFSDVLTAESGTTTIDGYTVISKKLPAGGLWQLKLNPIFSGTANHHDQKFNFLLLKDDNSVFAQWSVGRYLREEDYLELNGTIFPWFAVVHTIEMDWDGVVFSDEYSGEPNDFSLSTITSTRTWTIPHTIIARERCSALFPQDPSFSSVSGTLLLDTPFGNDVRNATTSYGPAQGDKPLIYSFPDLDASSSKYSLFAACQLQNRNGSLASAGTLRLGCQFISGSESNTKSIEVTALKVYQEPFLCDCGYGYYGGGYYDADCIEQTEKNEACEWPVICPVTAPHYTTPMWEVGEISEQLCQDEIGYTVDRACKALILHRRVQQTIATTNIPVEDVGPVTVGGVTIRSLPLDCSWTDAEDIQPIWSHINESTEANTVLRFKHNGGLLTDPANWSAGSSDVILRESGQGFPFTIETETLATDDSCTWRVKVTFRAFAWAVNSTVAANGYDVTASFPAVVDNTATAKILITNPQLDPAFFGTRMINSLYTIHEWILEKDVPRWDGPPPELSFSSADQTLPDPSSGNWYFLKKVNDPTIESVSSTVLRFRVQADTLAVPLLFPFPFTLVPRVSPRVPHP